MSAGCAIVASDTAPVSEVIKHNETGVLVDFFDVNVIAEQATMLLKNKIKRDLLGVLARQFIVKSYDLRGACLPGQLKYINGLSI